MAFTRATKLKPESANRLLELDALRGIAAFAVLLFHYTTRYDQLYTHPAPPLFYFSYGYFGVNLFFMISGFVIFMTLNKTRFAADFVVSRFSRLFPAYWVAIALTFSMVSVLGLPGKEVAVRDVLLNLTMFQEFLHAKHVDGVYWTLQVEILFYMFMLLLYQYRLLKHINAVLLVWVGARLAYGVAALVFGIDLSYTVGRILILSYIPYFSLGIQFYQMRQAQGIGWKNSGVIALALVTIALADGWLNAAVTGAFALVFFLFALDKLRWLATRPLVYLGTISYSWYLLHENIGWAVMLRLYEAGCTPNLTIAIAMTCTFALASALTFVVEKPALKYIRACYRAREKSRTELQSGGRTRDGAARILAEKSDERVAGDN